ncbi:MAG: hypothetical protein RPR97_01685, partial [Colwellia sp.]
YLDQLFLADLFAYKTSKNISLGLSNFFDAVEFPIEVNLDEMSAKGWFIKEKNTFELRIIGENNKQLEVTINQQKMIIPDTHFSIKEDDIYVDADDVSEWFKLFFEYNFTDLQVFIESAEPLPVQQRLMREQRKIYTSGINQPILPWRTNDYQTISSPVFDLQLNTSIREGDTFTSFSALGSHDIAYYNARYFINSDSNDTIQDVRLTFTEKSEDANLFGWLKASTVSFGDVTAISTAGTYNSHNSRGLVISNKKNTRYQQIDNNKINFNGDILPDWDIELYRNGILLAKQTSIENGRYEFNNIDLIFGDNEFEFILYGPQGQVETKKEDVFINKNVLNASQSSYELSLTQPNKSLLGLGRETSTDNQNFLFASQYNQGITDWFSFSLGMAQLFVDNDSDKQDYSLLTNLTLADHFLINTMVFFNQDNDIGFNLNARTSTFGQKLSYKYSQNTPGNKNQEPLNLNTPNTIDKSTNHNFIMTGQLFRSNFLNVNYQNNFNFIQNIFGVKSKTFTNQLGLNMGKFSIQNTLSWADINNEKDLVGGLSLQRSFSQFSTRLRSSYTIEPSASIDSINADISWNIMPGLQSQFYLDYSPETDKYRKRLGINWQQKAFNVNANFALDGDNEWSAGLSFRFTFGYQIDQDKFFINANPMTSDGALMVRVFEDKNLNNKFDPGEPLIEGAKVRSIQNFRQARTDNEGTGLLKNMPVGLTTDIVLDTGSLQNPFLIPTIKGISITPRAAYVESLDFPVVTSGEVEGIVYLKNKDGKEIEQAFVLINLINEKNEIVATTQTEYDGYYLFSNLLPGKYRASIDKDYLESKKFRITDDLQLTLTAQGNILNGSDFSLERLEFTSGFVAKSGSFDSLQMLKAYWYLIKKQNRQFLKQKAFYVFNKETSKFQLNLGFYNNIEKATTDCDKIVKANVNCSVNEFTFGR